MGSARVFGVLLLIAGVAVINGSGNLGRLLTPNEGCGFQPIPSNKGAIELHSSKGDWAWMGQILKYSSVTKRLVSKCTATLITSRHALTSPNCVSDLVRSIRLGQGKVFKDYKVVRMEVHPDADWAYLKNYVAILFLEEDVKFSDQVRPACLPLTESVLQDQVESNGELYRLVANSPFGISQPKYKSIKYTEVACQDTLETSVANTLFCAYTDKDATGDNNGDPFVATSGDDKSYPIYQIAMDAYNTDSYPPKFLKIHPYIQWINATINENQLPKNKVVYPLLRAAEVNPNLVKSPQINGRLLTPKEGCGFQPIPNLKRVAKFLESDSWPWMGSVIRYSTLAKVNGMISVCSATLITSRHALTSAYCANEFVRSIRLGQNPVQDFKVVKMEIHSNSDWVALRDHIAIVFLENDVDFSDQIRPVCLPQKETMSYSGLHRLVQGPFDVFQAMTYRSVKYEEVACKTNFLGKIPINNTLFCARSEDKTGLKGDPFIGIDDESNIIHQIGMDTYQVISNPSIFLNIQPYIKWIKETIAGEVKNEVIYPKLQTGEKATTE